MHLTIYRRFEMVVSSRSPAPEPGNPHGLDLHLKEAVHP